MLHDLCSQPTALACWMGCSSQTAKAMVLLPGPAWPCPPPTKGSGLIGSLTPPSTCLCPGCPFPVHSTPSLTLYDFAATPVGAVLWFPKQSNLSIGKKAGAPTFCHHLQSTGNLWSTPLKSRPTPSKAESYVWAQVCSLFEF